MDWPEIERKLQGAKAAFMAQDCPLLEMNANERSLTHKFAEHLQKEFPEWSVDCEYNRDGDDIPKRLRAMFDHIPADDENAQTVFPDIIVHHRGRQLDGEHRNLVVIEAKKSGNHDGRDREKLKEFKVQYGYSFTVLLRFLTGERPDIEIEPY